MRYDDNDKALILLSMEQSLKKRCDKWESEKEPSRLYEDLSAADGMIEAMEEIKVVALTLLSERYPRALRDIYQPPIVLYCRGDVSLLDGDKNLAVVGTRKPTRYGKDVAKQFAGHFAQAGYTVVSGLAYGIDAEAHRAALERGGNTIAVVATGLDRIYPPSNLDLAREIVEKGLIVSEYPLGTAPLAYRFPERNRIISGLCRGVLIPEAGLNSGSLITANYAVEQGRELFVVPGSIYSPQSAGCNLKLKELQAALVTSPEDIAASVKGDADTGGLEEELDLTQQLIVNMLEDGKKHFTEIIDKCGLKTSELSALLSEMEIFGYIRKLSGNYYEKTPF